MKNLVNLLFETQHLKRIKHEWWRMAWVQFPDSVAEHSLNAAQIWYIIAQLEWADPEKVCTILVRHDMAETRIWDMHKVASRYIRGKKEAEIQVMKEQFDWVPWEESIMSLFKEYEERETLEWVIAKDADYLEQAFQAKIYVEQWYARAQNRIDNVWKALQTESAKKIREEMTRSSSTDRRQWLKKIDTK